jgi:hypothetical protein
MARSKTKPTAKTYKPAATKTSRLYTVEVFLIGHPSRKPHKKDQRISRTIQIRGDQTLEDLHFAIFDAYDRYDEHLYEFQFGEWRKSRGAPRYVHPGSFDEYDDGIAGVADETTIESLGLSVGVVFRYWFDFGDDWWHQITVKAIDESVPDGEYPKIIDRVGKSPPQYPNDEDEDEDDGDE